MLVHPKDAGNVVVGLAQSHLGEDRCFLRSERRRNRRKRLFLRLTQSRCLYLAHFSCREPRGFGWRWSEKIEAQQIFPGTDALDVCNQVFRRRRGAEAGRHPPLHQKKQQLFIDPFHRGDNDFPKEFHAGEAKLFKQHKDIEGSRVEDGGTWLIGKTPLRDDFRIGCWFDLDQPVTLLLQDRAYPYTKYRWRED